MMMRLNEKLIIVLALFLNGAGTYAQSFYFSDEGSDQNTGTNSSAPWRSPEKLESISTLTPGDSILFERGATFRGTISFQGIGIPGNEIYVGAYGIGPDPVISGAIVIKDWMPAGENVWVATCRLCAGEPANLFMDGIPQPLGRFPNNDYNHITRSFGDQISFADTTLVFPDHFWNGAEVVVKSTRWTIDKLRVTHYTDKTFRLQQRASARLENGSGYFIQKHPATLDQNGEWFFDTETNRIFLYHQNPVDIRKSRIEVSVSDIGLEIANSDFITVEDLVLRNYRLRGASITRTNNVTLTGLEIKHSGGNGLVVMGCRNPTVKNTLITDSNNNGVEWRDNINGHFTGNVILRTGLKPGRGASGNGSYIAMHITAANPRAGKNIIENNRIDSTGYSAIDFRTGKTEIKNNLISNFCLIKDDGAGIYTWNNPYGDNIIEKNTIIGGVGSSAGAVDPAQSLISGIYVDDRSSNLRVVANTVVFCPMAGIFLHNANAIEITQNRLFGNGNHFTNTEKGQLVIKLDDIVPGGFSSPMNLKVTENTLVANGESSYCLFFSSTKSHSAPNLGIFLSNLYRAPLEKQTAAMFYQGNIFCNPVQQFTLPEWQKETALDQGSKFKRTRIKNAAISGSNLIENSTMTQGTSGWMIWPDVAAIVYEQKDILDGPSLKAEFQPGKKEALLYHAGINLDNKKVYRLCFLAKSKESSKIEFAPLAATEPWSALGKYGCFSLDTSVRKFIYFFRPHTSARKARVNFRGSSTFWIDNVSLTEVIPTPDKSDESAKLIFNSSRDRRQILLKGNYEDIHGNPVSGSVNLTSYSAMILLKAR